MELNWSTFAFEIINFLVLVWILQRFLYQPVLTAIARRREGIEQTLAESRARQSEAEALQAQYQNRLADWEREKQAAYEALGRDLEAERARRLEMLQQTLAQEREKARVLALRERQDVLRQHETRALRQAARFAATLLRRIADPALERRLVDLALEELDRLPPAQRQALREACSDSAEPPLVTSAYALDAERQATLGQALAALAPIKADKPCVFSQDAELIAGLRITIGPWLLQANLHDELQSFADAAYATATAIGTDDA